MIMTIVGLISALPVFIKILNIVARSYIKFCKYQHQL